MWRERERASFRGGSASCTGTLLSSSSIRFRSPALAVEVVVVEDVVLGRAAAEELPVARVPAASTVDTEGASFAAPRLIIIDTEEPREREREWGPAVAVAEEEEVEVEGRATWTSSPCWCSGLLLTLVEADEFFRAIIVEAEGAVAVDVDPVSEDEVDVMNEAEAIGAGRVGAVLEIPIGVVVVAGRMA